MRKVPKYLQTAVAVHTAARRSGMPRCRSKYSNRIFDQWVWIVLLVLRQYERKDYRGFIDWLEIATPITEYLQLKRIPHFTTLQKAAARLDSIAVRRIIGRFIRERDTEETLRIVSIYSTGYRMKHASRYYQTRLTYRGKKQDIRRKHLKSTISVDTKTLLIIAVKHRRGPASDHKVKTLSIIPARNEDVPVHRTKGKYRKEMKRGYNRKNYNRRVLVETENSVVKRRFSECIYSRKVRTQNRELELRYLAYNADRYVKLLLFISMRISTKPMEDVKLLPPEVVYGDE